MTSGPNSKRQSIPTAVRIAASHVGISTRRKIAPRAFLDALANRKASPDATQAVAIFLNEADPAELAELVASDATSFKALTQIAKTVLACDHPNRVHLEQLTT